MGQTTYVKPGKVQSKGFLKKGSASGVDLPFVLIVICLVIIGLLAVYSTSWVQSKRLEGSAHAYALRQIVWALLGTGIAFALSHYDYHKLKNWSLILMGTTIVLLVIVGLVGVVGRHLIGTSVQPSELAKAVIVIYLAVWLTARKDDLDSFQLGFIPVFSIVGIIGGLILMHQDYSAALTIFILGGLMFFFGGGKLWHIILMGLLMGGVALLLITVLAPDKLDRIAAFVSSITDPSAAPEQIQRAMQAISRGGIFGVGIGNSITKFTGLQVAWTDSIFAVIVEETGLVGGLVVIGLYMLFLWRGLDIANRAPDMFGKLLVSGMTAWIVVEALINMAVMLSLIPVAGNALPFISMGGSSMVTSLAAVGIILNISRAGKKTTKKSAPVERTSRAASDMRRRNGRRSVSRNVDSASTRAR
ncbi:MAG: FtsW/RodA/SpoVE family cell cycle protein [Anaerolineaceae bacterium]|jgi:cell division protein FtsW|nr:FtsW/RodA/SpoVE family cell cycle protein [Anaerolineaceae bacterium]